MPAFFPSRFHLGLAVLALALLTAAPAGADTSPDPGVAYDHIFEFVGEQEALTVAAGVRHIAVTAVGGRGAASPSGGIGGGRAAEVEGALSVIPGATYWVVVGSDGGRTVEGIFLGNLGGFNGGGSSGGVSNNGAAVGGGGGGASDIRELPTALVGSAETRMIVAAGGGGGGATANGGGKAGAVGGNAEKEGVDAESAGPGNTYGTGGAGGSAGSASSGGEGGEGGYEYGGGGSSGSDGEDGGEATGGNGGPGPNNSPPGWGGGGGGGLYGGGGGGGGALMTGGSEIVATGGGGGGGGSSLVPAGGSLALAPSDSTPYIRVVYATPGTVIAGPSGTVTQAQVSFAISSSDAGASFECRLDSGDEAAWKTCGASFQTPVLAEGGHVFEARAVNEAENFDPTPARVAFNVDLKTPAPPAPPAPAAPPAPTLHLGKAKLNGKTGEASVPVTVSQAGLLTLGGKKVKRTVLKAGAAGTVLLPIVAKGKGLRQLNRRGRAKVLVVVSLAAAGQKVTASKRLTLHQRRRGKN